MAFLATFIEAVKDGFFSYLSFRVQSPPSLTCTHFIRTRRVPSPSSCRTTCHPHQPHYPRHHPDLALTPFDASYWETFSKSHYIVTLYSTYNRALTFLRQSVTIPERCPRGGRRASPVPRRVIFTVLKVHFHGLFTAYVDPVLECAVHRTKVLVLMVYLYI